MRGWKKHPPRASVALTFLVLAAACASSPSTPATAPSSMVAPSVAPAAHVWVAVLGVARTPSALSGDRTDVVETLGDALEGAVVVSPTACLAGLPTGAPADGYVLAIQQSSRAEVLVLTDQVSREPSFVGPVHLLCTD
jgi:hypothetical protein